MDFELTEEQKMMKSAVREFAEKEIIPRTAEDDRKKSVPWDIVEKMKSFLFIELPSIGCPFLLLKVYAVVQTETKQ